MDHPDDRDDTHRLWRRLAGGSIPRAEARKMGAGRFGCDYAFVFSSVQIFRLFNQNLNQIFGAELPTQIFNLPIGISFYTFQAITYVVDVYRGKAQVQRSYANLLLYVALFPQLIAGPIVRYTDIAAQLENREMTLPGFSKGITRFVTGLGKKVLLANIAGQVATSLIGGDLSKASVLGAWLGIFAYTFQIYFDFPDTPIWRLGLVTCLASLMLRILIILIFLNLSRNFGAAGISA